MEVPSDEEAAGCRDISPIQINAIHAAASSFGGGHGHMIHQQYHVLHHHHDPSAAAAAAAAVALGPQNQVHSTTTITSTAAAATTNGFSHHPNRICLQPLHLDHDDEDDEDHVNNDIHIKAPEGVPKTKKSSSPSTSTSVVIIRYKECLKNHAAAMGGTATDGCCEFMPGGEEGTIEALNCSACKCHRNFHRKQIEGDAAQYSSNWDHYDHDMTISRFGSSSGGRNQFLLAAAPRRTSDHDQQQHHHHRVMPPPLSRNYLHHHNQQMMIMPSNYNTSIGMGMGMGMVGSIPSECDHEQQLEEYHDHDHAGGRVGSRPPSAAAMHVNKQKRFRTKFSEEQKQKMLRFAEKAGWKIQKQEESVVQQFCQDIGVKRRVLKVWMHNNKHNHLPKNIHNTPPPLPPPPPPPLPPPPPPPPPSPPA